MVDAYYVTDVEEPVTLWQYFKSTFRWMNDDYIKFRIKQGFIQVNMEAAMSDQLVKNGDFISSIIHRHESSVLDDSIEVIYEDDDILVVNKPASIVVYPITTYRLNSLMYILAKEKGYRNLRPIHRLDKLTSGVMIFAKVIWN